MQATHPQYVVDEQGNRTAVLLTVDDYQRLLEEIEEIDAVRAYDDATAASEKPVPFEEAVARIEKSRS